MAIEPKTIKETSIVIEGLEARLGLITKMVWAVIGMLGTLIAGAVALYSQLGDVKTDVAAVKATVAGINERLTGFDGGIREIRSAQTTAATTLARIDEATKQTRSPTVVPDPPEKVAAANAQFIRDLIKPMPTGSRTYAVGNTVTGVTVQLLPPDITAKLPELRGLGYVVDAKAAIALVDANYRVITLITS
jgi:hypothetical protein